ncbi:uncharacterized protein LOC122848432 isoform X2 [Aphidius gifuensis]|uniref:uncharacterized protein LOC122848432 isoform X2 n=1 Tax=Aphidius gifuensis TaxID=684658 RepID=UPI001CDD19BF|nr:uncharacterized protein LOC122848432 isoform X2 [Aphidius gifuensis]
MLLLQLGLVFSVILMLLVIPVQSAPSRMSSRQRLSKPAWINPCGSEIERDGQYQVDTDRNMTDDFENTVGPTLSLMKQAHSHAKHFRDKFLHATLRVGPLEATQSWRDMRYDWLPTFDQIPKHLGLLLSPEYLEKMEMRMLDQVFVNAYNYLQIYSVAIEQIVWDQKDRQWDFYDSFETMRTQTLAILCEIHLILLSRGITAKEPPLREHMPENARVADETYLHLRDWIILRDYMNSLEYFTQVFEHTIFMLEE